jgi:hypothetical protein
MNNYRDFRKTPDARPWAKELCRDDILSARQAAPFACSTRLADFGLELRRIDDGSYIVARLHREPKCSQWYDEVAP